MIALYLFFKQKGYTTPWELHIKINCLNGIIHNGIINLHIVDIYILYHISRLFSIFFKKFKKILLRTRICTLYIESLRDIVQDTASRPANIIVNVFSPLLYEQLNRLSGYLFQHRSTYYCNYSLLKTLSKYDLAKSFSLL